MMQFSPPGSQELVVFLIPTFHIIGARRTTLASASNEAKVPKNGKKRADFQPKNRYKTIEDTHMEDEYEIAYGLSISTNFDDPESL